MELELAVHATDRSFSAAGKDFPRGSLLVRRNENADDVEARVARAAERSAVSLHAVARGRSSGEGPDLGGQHFRLLARPRVAMLGNDPVWPDTFGHLWHLLDREIGLPVSMLDAPSLSNYDLRRYNVLILPPSGDGLDSLLKLHAAALRFRHPIDGSTVDVASPLPDDFRLILKMLRKYRPPKNAESP